MRLAQERQQVVLTQTCEADVFFKHHFVVLLRKGLLQQRTRVLVHSRTQLGVHPCHALGGIDKSFAIRVFADGQEDFSDRRSDALLIDTGRCGTIVVLAYSWPGVAC